jgi:hypothetical protein
MDLVVQDVFRFITGKVRGRHRIPAIQRRSAVSYPDRVPGGTSTNAFLRGLTIAALVAGGVAAAGALLAALFLPA